MFVINAELRSRPIFGGSGSDPSKIKRLRLRLLVNCKAENYEFVTTKKKIIFFPDTKLQNLHMFDFTNKLFLKKEKKIIFLVVTNS